MATRLAVQAVQVLLKAAGGKPAFEGEPWNSSSVDLIRLAKVGWVGGRKDSLLLAAAKAVLMCGWGGV